MGYGGRAITLLKEYYQGKFLSLDEERNDNEQNACQENGLLSFTLFLTLNTHLTL